MTITSVFPTLAQSQDPQDKDYERVVVGTSEILLDAVVKDKKGHVVKDLKPADFEIYEDGVKQEVRSFRLITREPGATPDALNSSNNNETAKASSSPTTVTPKSSSPLSTNRVSAVALVFDRLSLEARKRAHDAALAYLGSEVRPDDFIGVFNIDLSLKAVQPFTNNGQLVRQAIERITAHTPSSFSSSTGQITSLSQTQAGLQSQADASAGTLTSAAPTGSGQGLAGQSGPSVGDMASVGANAIDQTFTDMTERAVEGF
ncbi:MAG TPA: VWA domain-containing protein, partial [Pyrinomonadaceae bacterium]|nr:VWA domain-containing protein [Pyrinomonadaceae bacterium]